MLLLGPSEKTSLDVKVEEEVTARIRRSIFHFFSPQLGLEGLELREAVKKSSTSERACVLEPVLPHF